MKDERDIIAFEFHRMLKALDERHVDLSYASYVCLGLCAAMLSDYLGEAKLKEVLTEVEQKANEQRKEQKNV